MSNVPAVAARAGILSIKVAGERWALPARDVTEIIRPPALTRMPHAPSCLLGVANVHGTVVPVASLAQMLGHTSGPSSALSRIVVVQAAAKLGLLVDEVCGLGDVAADPLLDLSDLVIRNFPAASPRMAAPRVARDAARPAKPSEAVEELALVVVGVAGHDYALPLQLVTEIADLPPDILAVQGDDEAMIGVTTLRGRLIPLVSLRVLLGWPCSRTEDRAQILVTRIGGALAGLVVDRVKTLTRVRPDAIGPLPPVLTRGKGEAQIEAICQLDEGRRLIPILSADRLFDSATAARLSCHADAAATVAEPAAAEAFVAFRLGEEHYALPIASVSEVMRRPDRLARLPRAEAVVEGVMNLRGRTLPVIDPHRQFGVTDAPATARLLMVVTGDGQQAGFAVDAVTGVLNVPTSQLLPAPACATTIEPLFDRVAMLERDGRMILVIDPGPLLALTGRGMFAETVSIS